MSSSSQQNKLETPKNTIIIVISILVITLLVIFVIIPALNQKDTTTPSPTTNITTTRSMTMVQPTTAQPTTMAPFLPLSNNLIRDTNGVTIKYNLTTAPTNKFIRANPRNKSNPEIFYIATNNDKENIKLYASKNPDGIQKFTFAGQAIPFNNIITTLVTDMSTYLNSISFNDSISDWDVSNVTTMYGMFNYTASFNQPLNNWNTSNVTNMSHMFVGTPFNQDISNWNVSKVTDFNNFSTYGSLTDNNKPRFIAKTFAEPNRSGQTVSADKKSVFYNGYEYSTLSTLNGNNILVDADIGIDGSKIRGQYPISYYIPNGWEIAPNNSDSLEIIKTRRFNTGAMVLSDGSSYYTLNRYGASNPGDRWGQYENLVYNGVRLYGMNEYNPNVHKPITTGSGAQEILVRKKI